MDLVFDEAARQGDSQGQREALYQAGMALQSDDYKAQAVRMLGALPLQERGPEARVAMEMYRKIAWGELPSIGPVVSYCKAVSSDQLDRRGLCVQAAGVHARHARTLLDLAVAKSLATSGGDTALDATLTKELDALRQLMQDSSAPLMDVLARGDVCAAEAILRRQTYELASDGELSWARARLAAGAASP